MYLVAITRWAGPIEKEAAHLGPLIHLTAYDFRLRFAGPTPVIIASFQTLQEAQALEKQLITRGHGVISFDSREVVPSDALLSPREFEFENAAIVLTDPAWGSHRVLHKNIIALIHAICTIEEQSTTTSTAKKFSLGMAAMTGGLVMKKKVTTQSSSMSRDQEQVLYLMTTGQSYLLHQNRLHYTGLGESIGRTTGTNFTTLVSLLKKNIPTAHFDDSLLKVRRKNTYTTVGGTTKDLTRTSSNASNNDIIAHLIAKAHQQGQL